MINTASLHLYAIRQAREREASGKSSAVHRLLVGNLGMVWCAPSAAFCSVLTLVQTNIIIILHSHGSRLVAHGFVACCDRSCSYRLPAHLFVCD